MRSTIAALACWVLVLAACGGATTTSTSAVTWPSSAAGSTSTTVPAASTTLAAAPATTVPTTTTTTGFVPSGPGYGGEAVVGEDQEPQTLNPYAAGGDNFVVLKISQAIHTGVWDVDAQTLEIIPEVVTELPSVANGGLRVNDDGTMTVRYQILDEARWADGLPISGDDLAFTYELLSDPDIARATITAYGAENPYDLIVPGSMVAGPKALEFRMERPTVEWEQLFDVIVPKHAVEGSDFLADWHTTPWVSGGPFVFESWRRGDAITLVRNENYWKSDEATGLRLPYLDTVVFRFIPETAALLRSFKGREVDVINPPPWPPDIQSLSRMDGPRVDARSGPIWEHFNFQFGPNNRNEDSLNRHVLFRRAVALGIDVDAIVERITDGFGTPIDSYVRAFTPGLSTGAWGRYGHDPWQARDLLAELCADLERDCVAEPPRLVFSTTSNGDIRIVIADMLQDMLEEIGIDVVLELEDSALFFGSVLDAGTWDMGLWAWVGAPGLAGLVTIHDVFDPEGPPPDGSNYYRWGTAAVAGSEDPLFDQPESSVIDQHTARFAEVRDAMHGTVDADELIGLIREAESILADQVVIIPLYSRLDVGVVWADELGGYVHNPSQAGDTWNVERWYRVDR